MIQVINVHFTNSESISSYAYSLMAIAYLQHINVVPNLQTAVQPDVVKVPLPTRRREKKSAGTRAVDVAYNQPTTTTTTDAGLIWGPDGVAELFYGFMKYYGYEHVYHATNHVDVKQGGIVKGEDMEGKMITLDPFERERNTTGCVDKALKYLIPEFKRVCDLIGSDKLTDIFEPVTRSSKGRSMFKKRQ
jgi:hypothetical protein